LIARGQTYWNARTRTMAVVWELRTGTKATHIQYGRHGAYRLYQRTWRGVPRGYELVKEPRL
jgi:hypothetical protein